MGELVTIKPVTIKPEGQVTSLNGKMKHEHGGKGKLCITLLMQLHYDKQYILNLFARYQKFVSLGCCNSRPIRYLCLSSGILGCLLILVGLAVLVAGQGILEGAILRTMALQPGSDRLYTWLHPPVQPHLTGYGFHVTNPEAVMRGGKPVVEEIGPFTYKAVTVKNSIDRDTGKENLEYDEDGETLTYRQRLLLLL